MDSRYSVSFIGSLAYKHSTLIISISWPRPTHYQPIHSYRLSYWNTNQ